MQPSIEIRPATPEDVEHVLPMVQRLADAHRAWDPAKYPYKASAAEMYRSWLTSRATDGRSVFLVAIRDARAIAFLVGTAEREIPIYTLAEFGFIHDLWVEPDYRNEGIARQIVMLAIERFRAIGMTQVRLDTMASNEIARSLFRTCGFRASSVEMLLEMEGGDRGEGSEGSVGVLGCRGIGVEASTPTPQYADTPTPIPKPFPS